MTWITEQEYDQQTRTEMRAIREEVRRTMPDLTLCTPNRHPSDCKAAYVYEALM